VKFCWVHVFFFIIATYFRLNIVVNKNVRHVVPGFSVSTCCFHGEYKPISTLVHSLAEWKSADNTEGTPHFTSFD